MEELLIRLSGKREMMREPVKSIFSLDLINGKSLCESVLFWNNKVQCSSSYYEAHLNILVNE